MNHKTNKYHSLSRRIVAQFCIFTLILSAIFGLFTFILLYNLEDKFIERDVIQEADYLLAGFNENQKWPAVRSSHMQLYFSKDALPLDMQNQFVEEPHRKEFYGQGGRHYHLYPMPNFENTFLLAEVCQKLLVRPIREGVIKLLMISGFSLTFIAFIIAWLLGRKTAKPLKELADLVDGAAPKNLPSTFSDKFPNNEIGILAKTLENSMQQIAKALERERCFTRDVSHELRTPVAIIQNAVELYREKNTDEGSNKDIVDRINDASLQMEQTVTTLLHLAREEHADAQKTDVKLLPLIEESVIKHSHLLEGKDIEVVVEDSCSASILTQQGMLKVLLDNLLSNAFQYTQSGEVKVAFINNELIVEDTGPGIEKDISAHITQEAVKGSQSKGYGFGLSIVKRLCEHQNWRLVVTSDLGTRISVCFNAELVTRYF